MSDKMSVFPFNVFPLMQGFTATNGFGMEALVERQRQAMEAMMETNRAAIEGYQCLMTRQMEMAQDTMQQSAAIMRDMMTPGTPVEAASRQMALVQSVCGKAYENMRELTDLATEANTGAAKVFQDHMGGQIAELSAAASTGKANGKGQGAKANGRASH